MIAKRHLRPDLFKNVHLEKKRRKENINILVTHLKNPADAYNSLPFILCIFIESKNEHTRIFF